MNKMMTAALMSLVFVGMCAGAEEAAEAVADVTVAAEAVQEAAAPAPSTARVRHKKRGEVETSPRRECGKCRAYFADSIAA